MTQNKNFTFDRVVAHQSSLGPSKDDMLRKNNQYVDEA